MSMKAIVALMGAMLACVVLLIGPAASATWDLSSDFSTTNNPNGVWNYGWQAAIGQPLNSYNACYTPPYSDYGTTKWWHVSGEETGGQYGIVYANHGSVVFNLSTSVLTTFGTFDARQVLLFGPCSTETGFSEHSKAVVRWTSPVTGTVKIAARFSGQRGGYNSPGTVADVHIAKNSSSIWDRQINGFGGTSVHGYTDNAATYGTYGDQPYRAIINVSAGDTVDFVVGNGIGNIAWVGLAATITEAQMGSVTGTVYANVPGGPVPLAGARVQVDGYGDSAITAANGTYTIPLIPDSAPYKLKVTKSGYDSAQASVTVTSGGTATQNFTVNGGVIAGTIRSSAAGNPPVPGAVVRTLDGTCSAAADSAGAYSLTVAPGAYTILAGRPGYLAQQASGVTATAAGITPIDFTLPYVAPSASILTLPAPTDWPTPSGAPSAPGDAFAVSFADPSGFVDPSAPSVSEWNRTAKPGESFTMTGARFTSRTGSDLGTDTTVWIWANAPSGGQLRQAKVWRVTESCLTAAVPSDLPFGMYLVWVENSSGASAPVCVNRTQPQWVGPLGNSVQAGATKRVFGKNISKNHGMSVSYVYIQPSAGGGFISCPVTGVEPYVVTFTVPAGTANGSYKVYVHNGHGGQYGWGDPLDMVVADPWVRGASEIAVSPTGADDTSSIQSKLNQQAALPNGGTVRLSAANYKISGTLNIPSKVRLAGAGMDATTLEFRPTAACTALVIYNTSYSAIEELTIYGYINPVSTSSGLFYVWAQDARMARVRFTGDPASYPSFASPNYSQFANARCEMTGCEGYREVSSIGADNWLHDNTFYGYPYGYGESAMTGPGDRGVAEHNYVATKDWPIGPGNSRNYQDFLTQAEEYSLVLPKRVMLYGGNKSYVAWTTTKDVAVQDNRGEILLFHGGPGSWWGQVLSNSGTTMKVRTDGLVFGQQVNIYPDYLNGYPQTGGQRVPTSYSYGYDIIGSNIVIVGGRGVGQSRTIVARTSDTITMDSPWRVEPDATSVVVQTPLYRDHIVYMNDLNAFPPGYVQGYSASCMVEAGNGWGIDVESTTSHRTYGGGSILGDCSGVSYWCTLRDDKVYDASVGGMGIGVGALNPLGFEVLGNRILGCLSQVTGATTYMMLTACDEGSIVEGSTVSGGGPGIDARGESIFRNNNLSVAQSGNGVYLSAVDSNPVLLGNTYSGVSQTYAAVAGSTFAQKPLPEYHAARFSGYVGQPVGRVVVPVANAGIAGMTWTATPSDSWISASIVSGPTVATEAETGRLAVSVDTTGMSAGRHWGYIDIISGGKTARVGVCVDLASGGPGNHAPSASFAATPLGGTAPMAVTMDASASVDVDGSIAGYAWDFGDGTIGSGAVVTHTYSSPGTYAPTLVVTDDDGATDTAYATITVAPALTSATLTGLPKAPIDSGTPVTLTASAVGGYLVQYKFVVNSGSGWTTLRDYSISPTAVWMPGASGYYRLKVYVRNTGSNAAYDIVSNELGYPVGLLRTSGMSLWLRGDIGITSDASSKVSGWTDQSSVGNNASQSYAAYRPTCAPDSGNGSPAVTFATGNVIMNTTNRVITGISAFTCFVLLKYNGAAIPVSNEFVFWNGIDNSATGGYGIWLDSSSHLAAGWGLYASRLTDTDALVGGQWYVFTTRYGGGSHQIWVNGTAKGSTAKSNSNMSSGGGSVGNKGPAAYQGFDGDIQEMIVYNRALTDTERAGVESYLATKYQPQVKTSISSIRSLPDGSIVSLTSPKVATASSGTFVDRGYYLEEPDRSSGIRVMGQVGQPFVSVGDSITVNGTVGTDANGEKMINISAVTSQASGDPLGCLGMANKSAVQGLLVKVWGKVKEKTSSYLTLDDGSGITVRVQTDGLAAPLSSVPDVGAYISAAGPCGIMPGGVTAVRVRSSSDIQAY